MSGWDSEVRRVLCAVTTCTVLVSALASSFATHNHSVLGGDDGFSLSAPATDQFLTRHDPLSCGMHCHAVIAVVHEQDCVACHAQRLPGALAQRHQSQAAPSVRTAFAPRLERKLAASLPTSGSRAPPVLL